MRFKSRRFGIREISYCYLYPCSRNRRVGSLLTRGRGKHADTSPDILDKMVKMGCKTAVVTKTSPSYKSVLVF